MLGAARREVGVIQFGGDVEMVMLGKAESWKCGSVDEKGILTAVARAGLVGHGNLISAGWNLCSDDLAHAVRHHAVSGEPQLAAATPVVQAIKTRAAFCRSAVASSTKTVHGPGAHTQALGHELEQVSEIELNAEDVRPAVDLERIRS